MDATGSANSLLLYINSLVLLTLYKGSIIVTETSFMWIGIYWLVASESHKMFLSSYSGSIIGTVHSYTALLHSLQGILAAVYIPQYIRQYLHI